MTAFADVHMHAFVIAFYVAPIAGLPTYRVPAAGFTSKSNEKSFDF
jgi:hypothetical protein